MDLLSPFYPFRDAGSCTALAAGSMGIILNQKWTAHRIR